MKAKILIIEDAADLAKGLKINLEAEGYAVSWAATGKDGLRKSLAEEPDLVILDVMLPEMDGFEVCREMRKKGLRAPVIMLTAKSEEVDKVVGLEVGADDYVTKPFSVRELLARIRAHLRRAKSAGPAVPRIYRFGKVEVDFGRFKLVKKGREIDLTSLEIAILKFLIAHRGDVVTREALLEKIWGYETFPTTRTIDNHILKLRKKIEDDPARPRHLLSIYGEGYRFLDESV
jgi:two-component system alkaline phosphatase synthesis response regulator PhoP